MAMQGVVELSCREKVFEYSIVATEINPSETLAFVKSIEPSAKKGDQPSQGHLGSIYEYCIGADYHMATAVRWYSMAAQGAKNIHSDWARRKLVQLGHNQPIDSPVEPKPGRKPKAGKTTPVVTDPDEFINHAFSNLIGLKSVLDEVRRQSNLIKIQKQRAEQGLHTGEAPSRHMVFSGPPGTGKTTVARIIAGLYHRLGLLPTDKVVETSRSDLVGGYIGQTAIQTKGIVKSALGGVLFIDEAYTLARGGDQDFGQEAIDTLLKMMEDHRTDLLVIVAGYGKEMETFLESNPGLASRFSRHIVFPNYSPKELVEIFEHQFTSNDFVLEEGITTRIEPLFAREVQAQRERFGNARYVRNVFERTQEAQANRLANQGKAGKTEMQKISLNDVESALGEELPSESGNSVDKVELALAKLNRLIGLARVKEQVADIADYVRVQRERTSAGFKTTQGFSQHLVFSGSPGTGKTTVARIIADIYFSLGIVPSDRLVEVDRAGLVGEYVGSTAQKTEKVIQKALGGVLFIDEAYELTPSEANGNDFGKEAVEEILKAMEDYRDQLVVIVAGYTEKMHLFIESNPGLKSRFNHYIHFDDYSPSDLLQIFMSNCSDGDYVLQEAAQTLLSQWLAKHHQQGGTDGNGRFARNLYQRCVELQSRRVAKLHSPTPEDLQVLTIDDIALATRDRDEPLPEASPAIPAPVNAKHIIAKTIRKY
jgi:SpoVK/Ycf46/Vps4 family AAA+-type ATPase